MVIIDHKSLASIMYFLFSDGNPTQGFARASEYSNTRLVPILKVYSWVITKSLALLCFPSANLAVPGLEVLKCNKCLFFSVPLPLVLLSRLQVTVFRMGSSGMPTKMHILPAMVQGKWFQVWMIFSILVLFRVGARVVANDTFI